MDNVQSLKRAQTCLCYILYDRSTSRIAASNTGCVYCTVRTYPSDGRSPESAGSWAGGRPLGEHQSLYDHEGNLHWVGLYCILQLHGGAVKSFNGNTMQCRTTLVAYIHRILGGTQVPSRARSDPRAVTSASQKRRGALYQSNDDAHHTVISHHLASCK
jgi:hypothetical protein